MNEKKEIKIEDLRIGQEVWYLDIIYKVMGLYGRTNSITISNGCNTYYVKPYVLSLTPPKKKIKKTKTLWFNIYPEDIICLHSSQEFAKSVSSNCLIATISQTIVWEEDEK